MAKKNYSPSGARPPRLTVPQEQFLNEYLADSPPNATRAYMRCFPKVTVQTARANAARMLARASVRQELRRRQAALRKASGIDAERAIREAARLAFSDIGDVADLSKPSAPRLRKGGSIHPDARKAVQEISQTANGVKIKLYDKGAALDRIFKHLGLYRELPPLDAVLALLPDGLRERVRAELAQAVLAGGSDSAASSAAPAHLDDRVPGSEPVAGPVAETVPLGPLPTTDSALLPASGQDDRRGGSDVDALFDDP